MTHETTSGAVGTVAPHEEEGGIRMTPDLVEQLPDLERKADELERQAEAIRQIIAGVRALNGDANAVLMRRSFESHRTSFEIAPRDPYGPRGPAAVLQIMGEAPQQPWKVIELKREMLRRGWAPTPKAVEASVKRLRAEGQIVPISYGHYALPSGALEDAQISEDGES